MKTTLEVQNLKCSGCVNTIVKKLNNLPLVSNLEIDIDSSTVSFNAIPPEETERVVQRLSELGYPLLEEKNSLGKVAKSYISCAIGRVQR